MSIGTALERLGFIVKVNRPEPTPQQKREEALRKAEEIFNQPYGKRGEKGLDEMKRQLELSK